MTAPLAQFLTHFSPAPAPVSVPLDDAPAFGSIDTSDPTEGIEAIEGADFMRASDSMGSPDFMGSMDLGDSNGSMDAMGLGDDLVETEPTVTMTVSELEAKLAVASQDALVAAEERFTAELAALTASQEESVAQALAAARAKWAAAAGENLATSLETAIVGLRDGLAARIADVLRPFVANAVAERTKVELIAAIDRLLSDPSQPLISIRGPKDLGSALRAARPDARIEWTATKKTEVTIIADATRIETRLAAALAEIAATET